MNNVASNPACGTIMRMNDGTPYTIKAAREGRLYSAFVAPYDMTGDTWKAALWIKNLFQTASVVTARYLISCGRSSGGLSGAPATVLLHDAKDESPPTTFPIKIGNRSMGLVGTESIAAFGGHDNFSFPQPISSARSGIMVAPGTTVQVDSDVRMAPGSSLALLVRPPLGNGQMSVMVSVSLVKED